MRIIVLFSSLFILATRDSLFAQQKWDLRKCVDYGLANNITIKQSDIQAKLAALQYKQAKLAQYPSAGLSGNTAFNAGRNQDPTSYSLITQNYLSTGLQLQTSADIFNWFSKRNTVTATQWEAEAAKASVDKLRDDIALTIANFYLQILLTKEQENIALLQLQQSQAQLSNTLKLVKAGALPELNAAELEAQVARDSASVITARGAVEQNTLSLKSYMCLDAAAPFEIETPPAELIPVEPIADLLPENVFILAVANLPLQRVNEFKLKAAQKNTATAKAGMYPTLSAYGSLGTGYNSRTQHFAGIKNVSLATIPFANVKIDNTDYAVFPLQYEYDYEKTPFSRQFDENFRQSIGLSISIPILSGGSLRTNWERSKLNIKNLEFQKDADNQKLKQDIYQAYSSAIVAMEKFNASKKTVAASQRTYDFAQKRYTVGMLGTFELITNQNNLFRAKLEYAANQFDYVFKMKVLEFYKGQGLKL